MKKVLAFAVSLLFLPAVACCQFATPGGTQDSIGIDTTGGGVDYWIYPAYMYQGANIDFDLVGDTLYVKGPAGAGTADSIGVDTDRDGAIDDYLYSTTGAIAMLAEGVGLVFTVGGDSVYMAVDLSEALTWTTTQTFTPSSAISAIFINQDNNAPGLHVDHDGATSYAIDSEGKWPGSFSQDIADGFGLRIIRDNADAETYPLVRIENDNVSDTKASLSLQNDGSGPHITTSATNENLEIDPDGTGATVVTGGLFDYTSAEADSEYLTHGGAAATYITATLTEEEVEDYVGTMVDGGTETNIAVTYTDGGEGAGLLNFVVDSEPWDSVTAWGNMINVHEDSIVSWANEVNAATDSLASWANEVNAATDTIGDWTGLVNEAKDSLTAWGDIMNTAYVHSQDNTQGHSDYLLNSGSDVMGGTLTADGLTLGANEDITLGSQTLDHDGTSFVFNDDVVISGIIVTSDTLTKSFVIQTPVAADHDFPFWMSPKAITLIGVSGVCISGTNVVGCLMEYDNDAANPVVCNSSDWTFTTGEERTTSLSNASIDAGDYLGWKTTSVSGSVDFLTITFEYTQP